VLKELLYAGNTRKGKELQNLGARFWVLFRVRVPFRVRV